MGIDICVHVMDNHIANTNSIRLDADSAEECEFVDFADRARSLPRRQCIDGWWNLDEARRWCAMCFVRMEPTDVLFSCGAELGDAHEY